MSLLSIKKYQGMFSANCLKFFVGLALTATFILPTYIYFFLSPDFQQLVVDNSVTEAKRVSNHLISSFILGDEGGAGGTIHERLLRNEKIIQNDFQIEQFKFIAPSGQILYSTNHTEIGSVNEQSYFKEIVAQGKPYTNVVTEGSRTLEGRLVPYSVVETYVPIIQNAAFVGAFEIYYDITRVKSSLDRLMVKVYTAIAVIGAVMVLVTCFSFCRARKAIAEKKLMDEEMFRNFQTEVIFNKLFQLSLVKTSIEEILEIFIYHLTSLPWIEVEPKGAFFLVNDKAKVLELKAQRGLSAEVLSCCSRVAFGTCICGRTATSEEWFFPDSPGCEALHDIHYPGMVPHGHYCVPIHASSGVLLGVYTLYTKDGVSRHPQSGKLFLAVANIVGGIIERKQLEDKLRNISITDELTGLFNRRGFRTLAQQELDLAERHKAKMAVFYIDLDGLKHINDMHGHNAGDQAIQDTAEILRETFRAADIISRIGGDEFAVFGSFSPDAGSLSILKQRLNEHIIFFNCKNNRPYTLSCSVGVAYIIPEGPGALDDILSQADSAMYAEKRKKNLARKQIS
ncbi:MAG: sensor domain-containing diguanylate cyclase [Proteobacteria bacterium]|nr:sensor domain-containing diguanylate cyclase [Pseudomonadota bacterium]MBU1641002.1 sensor domain-containing diguanylate cyclase [Pseudomonadota bacterium]